MRWTAGIVLVLALIGGTAGLLGFQILRKQYGATAAEFDLGEMREMESASLIYDRTGQELGVIFIQNRTPVPLREVNPSMVEAVIAAEDNRFYEHSGVDWLAVVRAAIANYREGRIAQGASTVTQQLARNSFEMRERTFQRKLLEMFLAIRIEEHFTKDEIMEMYLNRVYFGGGFYGVEAAARGYFGKSASDLTIGESATLAGLLKSPVALSPWNNLKASTASRNHVLRRMREQGFLSRAEMREERDSPLLTLPRTNPHKVSYAADYIRQQAIAAVGFERAMNGGFRIHTTLDADLQEEAEIALLEQLDQIESREGYPHNTFAEYRQRFSTLEDRLNRGDFSVNLPRPDYLQGAVLALDNATGGILVMVGGRDFLHSEYNRAMQSRRPPGTAFTPFVYAAAFEEGFFPGDLVDDSCIDNRYVMVGGATGILGEWGVEVVENEYEGRIPAREALARGKNAATVRLGLFHVGLEKFTRFVRGLGIRSPLREYANAYLGSSEVTLEELTLAYTVFPNLGERPKRTHIIDRIEDRDGQVIYRAPVERTRTMGEIAAWQTHSVLGDAIRNGTGSPAYGRDGLQVEHAAGKTGTAYNFTDTYFVGYTRDMTCGVWIGFDRPRRIYRGAFGRNLALPVWTRVLNRSALGNQPAEINRPASLEAVEICRASGLAATPRCQRRQTGNGDGGEGGPVSTTYIEFAAPGQRPEVMCDVHGLGVRSYARNFEEAEWPRAASPLDLSRVRPVAVESPPLLGLNDVYHAVNPGVPRFADGEIPIVKPPSMEGDSIPEQLDAIPVALPVHLDGQEPPVLRPPETPYQANRLLETPVLQVERPQPLQFR